MADESRGFAANGIERVGSAHETEDPVDEQSLHLS